MKKIITRWYTKQIAQKLDRGILLDDIEVKLGLSVLKSLHAKWLMDTFIFMTSQAGSDVISNGWNAAGITEAVSKGLSGLKSLDVFKSRDTLVELNVTVDQSDREIDANQRKCFITTQDDDGDKADEDWVLEETGKKFAMLLIYLKIYCIMIYINLVCIIVIYMKIHSPFVAIFHF